MNIYYIQITKLTPKDFEDFSDLIKVFEEVFEWEDFLFPNSPHLQKLLNNSNFIVYVAKINKKLVGGLTAHVLEGMTQKNLLHTL